MFLLNIVVSDQVITIVIIAFVVIVIYLIDLFGKLKARVKKTFTDQILAQENTISNLQLAYQRDKAQIALVAQTQAIAKFEAFKENELEDYKKIIMSGVVQENEAFMNQWVIVKEDQIRKDARKRSMAGKIGKITEHLIPFGYKFKELGLFAQDAKFIGSPIDFIIFNGLGEKEPIITIYFVEIKTSTSSINENQKKVKNAVENLRVKWLVIDNPEIAHEDDSDIPA